MDCTIFTHTRWPHDFETTPQYNSRLENAVVPKRNGGRARTVLFRLPRDPRKRSIQLVQCREIQLRIDDTDSGYKPYDVQERARDRALGRGSTALPSFGANIPYQYDRQDSLRGDQGDSGYGSTHASEESREARRHVPRKGIRQDPEPASPRDGTPIPELPRKTKRQAGPEDEVRTVAEQAAIFEAAEVLKKVGLECWVSPSGKRQ
jgi:hypothetical protein